MLSYLTCKRGHFDGKSLGRSAVVAMPGIKMEAGVLYTAVHQQTPMGNKPGAHFKS